MTKIKICGLKSLEDVAIINEVMPEYVGFVFAKSKRKVSKEQAIQMRANLEPKIQVVGVFVNEPIEHIIELCSEGVIDCVQLHGEEALDYVLELKAKIEQPIIYARRLVQQGVVQFEQWPVDFLLFDTYVKDVYGGSGKLIDYECVPKVRKPIFLAGGLTAETVGAAITSVSPYCVDVSSGVETNGTKDRDKIFKFVEQVRNKQIQGG